MSICIPLLSMNLDLYQNIGRANAPLPTITFAEDPPGPIFKENCGRNCKKDSAKSRGCVTAVMMETTSGTKAIRVVKIMTAVSARARIAIMESAPVSFASPLAVRAETASTADVSALDTQFCLPRGRFQE
ncbi:hypothetical protein D8B26_002723 [Coccidioides posadasii str. Silveira]|uniref:Uncharacterized protein n=1 Tax=Coccidioides posadasii (strain RMSCC 757 / Silveira) TaxID=443226 RepID=E9CYH6_COCPS|nr:conserved hypothetical protein [Coccidioides posadasii str. Silveira]QVM08027.1 hypothetical protein D8B26_002723 [Coccidioides posadasii str. Silveira]